MTVQHLDHYHLNKQILQQYQKVDLKFKSRDFSTVNDLICGAFIDQDYLLQYERSIGSKRVLYYLTANVSSIIFIKISLGSLTNSKYSFNQNQLNHLISSLQTINCSQKLQLLLNMNKNNLNLKGQQYQQLIQKFKEREEQRSLEEALVYLRLRQFQCQNKKALIFSKKKQQCIDGTIQKDGPAGFKKLNVMKPESKLVNVYSHKQQGWLRGEKLKYQGTTGYTEFLRTHESEQKKAVTFYNQQSRREEQALRKARSKSTVSINMSKARQSLQKIGALKEDASKQRENRNMYLEYSGIRLDQTTKHFFKDTQHLDDQGLIVKLGAFDNIIADKELEINVDVTNMRGKSLTIGEIYGTKKRDHLIAYQEKIKELTNQQLKQLNNGQKSWKKLIYRTASEGKGLMFSKNSVSEASNPLILMNSKSLKRELSHNEKKYSQSLTKYSNFYNNIDKAMKLQFLDKRKYLHSELTQSKKKKLVIQN